MASTQASQTEDDNNNQSSSAESSSKPCFGPDSTGASLLKLIDKLPRWAGDDFEECLDLVYATRIQASFETGKENTVPTSSNTTKHGRSTKDRQALSPNTKRDEVAGKTQHPVGVPATALLAHFGRWHGDDLQDLTEEVYQTRSKVRF